MRGIGVVGFVAIAACSSGKARTVVREASHPPAVSRVAPTLFADVLPPISIETRPTTADAPLWSPDGRLFATISHGVQIRDGTTGAMRAELDEEVHHAAWTDDGSALVLLMYRGAVVTIRVADGAIHRLPPDEHRHVDDFGVFAIDRAGTRLVVGGSIATSLWDLESGKHVTDLEAHDYTLRDCPHCAGDGRVFVAPREDGTVDTFDFATGARTGTLRYAPAGDRASYPMAMAIGGAGEIAISTMAGRIIVVGGPSSPALPGGAGKTGGQLGWAAGHWILVDINAAMWDGKGDVLASLAIAPGGDSYYTIQRAGDRFALGSRARLQIFDAATGRLVRALDSGSLSPDGKSVAMVTDDALAIVDVDSGATRATAPLEPTQGGDVVAVASERGDRMWLYLVEVDLATGRATRAHAPAEPERFRSIIATSPDGTRAIVAKRCEEAYAGCACIADARTEECIATLEHANTLSVRNPWRFSPDGKRLAHIARDEYNTDIDSIQIYDAITGKRARVIPGHARAVGWAAPDVVAFVDRSARLRLLRLADDAVLDLVMAQDGDPRVLAVTPDGRFDGDESLLARVYERDGASLAAPMHSLAAPGVADRLRRRGLYASFLRGEH